MCIALVSVCLCMSVPLSLPWVNVCLSVCPCVYFVWERGIKREEGTKRTRKDEKIDAERRHNIQKRERKTKKKHKSGKTESDSQESKSKKIKIKKRESDLTTSQINEHNEQWR